MKIALLSDIHGNNFALEAVLNEVKCAGISKLLVSGDFVGYYYNADRVLELLSSFDVVACRGNHEDLFKSWLVGSRKLKSQLASKYGSCFSVSEKKLTQKQVAWLDKLEKFTSFNFDEKKFYICHGSPWDMNLYLYENTIDNYLDDFRASCGGYNVVVIGHSHHQFIKKIEDLIIINPGSVGQPRSKGSIDCSNIGARAQWATIEMKNMSVDFHTTMYSASELFNQINKYDPSFDYLQEVLLRR